MPHRTPAIIATVLTILILIFVTIAALLAEMIMLNGVGERQGFVALGASLLLQVAGWVLGGLLAWRLTSTLIGKYHWHRVITVAGAAAAGVMLGSVLAFLSILVAIPLAGIW